MSAALEILYRDDEIIAIHKPAGLLVHRSRIDVHANEFAVQKLRQQIGQPVFLIHRLDRPTSGVLLFALNADCARQLCFQFENHEVSKCYRAIVRGFPPVRGRWDEALVKKPDKISDHRAAECKAAQPASTIFHRLRRWQIPISAGKYPNSRYSELRIVPLTGRTHQIRRHFNHMSHPIIGDSSHGDTRHNRLFREHLQGFRLLLVAWRIAFLHPRTQKRIEIKTKLDADYQKVKQRLTDLDEWEN